MQECPAEIKRKRCANKQSTAKNSIAKLPKGLVGSRCTAVVNIAGNDFNCLLDTGLQVSTIPVSFYNQNLSDQQIHSLNNLLEVEGAAGHSIPYLGYVEVTVGFPKDFLGADIEAQTLALVVPDSHSETSSQVLIGTNTLDVLYEQYFEGRATGHQPSLYGYRAVLKTLEARHQQYRAGNVGVVRMLSQTPTLIPAGHSVILEGSAKVHSLPADRWALVEHPTQTALPGGLCVKSCLVTFPCVAPHTIPVVVMNETDQAITLPPLSVIAELGAFHSVISRHSVIGSPVLEPPPQSDLKFNFGDSPLPPEWKERITKKFLEMPEVFSHHDLDFECTDKVKHHITLHDETPFKHRARPIHPQDIEAVRQHLHELLESGVIRESESPFSSPIVVVRKRNGDVRLCIDYRKLNLQTVKDAYALPNLEETFSALTGSKWFTVLDLKSGYYQIAVEEADKAKTAFVTPLGFWEFNRMPQGITNAPSTFQRLMEKCMGELHLKEVLVFLDDLIIFSDTLEEHEHRLMKVLTHLKDYGLKLSLEKCKFFQKSVRYLGHVVSEYGVETDPEKIAALKTWPVPRNLKELRSFLGFSGYYRRFIKNYAAIVKPLNELTRGYPPLRKNIKGRVTGDPYHDPKQPFGGRWTPECQNTFHALIEQLTTTPVLGFPDPKKPYILHTDASTTGLGAALYQMQDGKLRVVAFASRGLSHSESRYPAHKLEFLALKWSVTEKFHDYLYGSPFTVVTDSNPLMYILTSAKLDATSYRWLAALSNFSFKLQFRAGKLNLDADGLSRRPHEDYQEDSHSQKEQERISRFTQQYLDDTSATEVISPAVVDAICQSCLIRTSLDSESRQVDITLVESLAISADAIPDSYISEEPHGLPVIPSLSHHDLKEKQRADPCLREVICQMETGEKIPPTVRTELPELPYLLREWNRLELQHGILYRRRQEGDQIFYQLVLPEELRELVLQSLHNDMGHMGIERTLDLVRARFYWPKLAAAVEHKIKTCDCCVRRKALPEKAAPLVNIRATRPLELVCMDFLSLEPDTSNTKDILVLTDHFTKFAVAMPTPNQKAKTVAKYLWDNFIVHYGIPERLHTDQGPDFESRLIKELCEVAGIQKVRTTPYHPRGNPVERFNRTLLNMLGTLENKQKSKWREFVKPLVHAYNCPRNEVTGFTPYELMFGRSPRLPVDLAFGLPVRGDRFKSHSQYVQDLKSRLEECYKLASRHALKTAERNKVLFDKKVTTSDLDVGDRVLVRNVRLRGKHKLSDKWEADIYVVIKRAGTLPVYTVRPENKDGPTRTLHRDLLLPCGFLPVAAVEELPQSPPVCKPRTRRQPDSCDGDIVDSDIDEEAASEWGWRRYVQPTVKFTVGSNRNVGDMVEAYNTADSGFLSSHPPTHSSCLASAEEHVRRSMSVEPPLEINGVGYLSERGEDNNGGNLSGTVEENLPGTVEENLPETMEESLPETMEENLPETMEENLPGTVGDNLPADTLLDGHLPESEELGGPGILTIDTATEAVDSASDSPEVGSSLRRSQRHREQPERFQYHQLGNPLVYIAQSLFQSLSTAYTEALSEGIGSRSGSNPKVHVV